jgi:hypothetical protein
MDEIILTEEQKEELDMYSQMYKDAEDEFKVAEAKKKSINQTIKNLLSEYGVTKYANDSMSLNMSSRPNISWKEDELLAFCKNSGIDGLVKTQEIVDTEALESAVYRGQIDPQQLKQFQIVKPDIVTLKMSQKKTLNG